VPGLPDAADQRPHNAPVVVVVVERVGGPRLAPAAGPPDAVHVLRDLKRQIEYR
jgi:hypothetical protein